MGWLRWFRDWWLGLPHVEEPKRKPNLWRFYQAHMTFNGDHVPTASSPVVWTSREALVREIEREKGGIQLMTQCKFADFPPDVALYRYTDHEGQWRYFFICREKEGE
jgi:hypothetical protein